LSQILSSHGSFQPTNPRSSIDDPFTLASATDSQRLRLRGRCRWANGTSVTASYRHKNPDNDRSGWDSKRTQTVVRLAHAAANWQLSLRASSVDLDHQIEQLALSLDGFRKDYLAQALRAGVGLSQLRFRGTRPRVLRRRRVGNATAPALVKAWRLALAFFEKVNG
jgi:hypothetical protein